MIQGDLLAMIAYDIGVLPLIQELREAHPHVTQPEDDTGGGGEIRANPRTLPGHTGLGTTAGILPVTEHENLGRSPVECVLGQGIIQENGEQGRHRIRYIGGFVGNREAEDNWMEEKVQGWVELVKALSGVSCKNPKSDYAGLQKSLQQE